MAIEILDYPNFGRFVLRASFGTMFLLHGLNKIRMGVGEIQQALALYGIPEFFAYLVFLSQIVVPILIIIGVFTRLSSFFGAFTCALAMYHVGVFFQIDEITGVWILEPFGVYFFAFASLMFLGSGKFALRAD